jgi:hypothetical protein
MRSTYFIGLVLSIATVPVKAQELGTFAASSRLQGKGARNFYGGGVSLGAFSREGTARIRVGIRASVLALSLRDRIPC